MGESEYRSVEVQAGAEEIKLGSMLFTIVEPHRGYEAAYNRWYERDHLYSGCMIGPYNFAARRFVATSDLKKLRSIDSSEITGEPLRGSYLAMYWILADHASQWGKWAGYQVHALHDAGRMFEERDHVHTLLYNFAWESSRDSNGVPAELALDHPFHGVIATFVDRSDDVSADEFDRWLTETHLPGVMSDTAAALVLAFRPQSLRADAPDVPKQEATDRRLLLVWFLNEDPEDSWDVIVAHHGRLEAAGKGTIVAALPFIPTIPGTDTYTDQLWLETDEENSPESGADETVNGVESDLDVTV